MSGILIEVIPFVLKNNLGIILGSESETIKNIEAQEKARCSCKKRRVCIMQPAIIYKLIARVLFSCMQFYKKL